MKLPTVLVPVHIPGNYFSNRDPISSGWEVSSEVIVYKYSATIMSSDRKLYYRLTEGCDCKLYYDGQEDLLFNLDNKHLFYYGMLFQYLHLMIEGKNP